MDAIRGFDRLVVIEKRAGLLHRVASVREAAEILIGRWPAKGRGKRYVAALQGCHDALAGEIPTETARQAFIEAAREVDLFVREAPLRG